MGCFKCKNFTHSQTDFSKPLGDVCAAETDVENLKQIKKLKARYAKRANIWSVKEMKVKDDDGNSAEHKEVRISIVVVTYETSCTEYI